MSAMGNLVLAIQEEVELVMDPSFSFHPSELGLSRFEIASRELKRSGFWATAGDCEQVWEDLHAQDYCEL
jgi:hypothetical protein